MPTYRNDGNQGHMVINADGARVVVGPGETVETSRIYDLAGLTKTADTPRYNPVAATSEIVAEGAGDVEVAVAAETESISIINKSDADVDVFWGAATNTPSSVVPAGTVRSFSEIKDLVDKLICRVPGAVAAGKLYVFQSR